MVECDECGRPMGKRLCDDCDQSPELTEEQIRHAKETLSRTPPDALYGGARAGGKSNAMRYLLMVVAGATLAANDWEDSDG